MVGGIFATFLYSNQRTDPNVLWSHYVNIVQKIISGVDFFIVA